MIQGGWLYIDMPPSTPLIPFYNPLFYLLFAFSPNAMRFPSLENPRSSNWAAILPHHHPLQPSHITLLGRNLKIPIDNSNSQQNPRPASQRAHQIGRHAQRADAGAAEGCGRRDYALEFAVHALFAVAGHDETLFFELFGYVAGGGAGDFDPGGGLVWGFTGVNWGRRGRTRSLRRWRRRLA